MARCTVWLAALVLSLAARGARAESESQCIRDLVCVEVAWNDDRAVISARNRLQVPAGVRLEFQQLSNVQPVPRLQRPRIAEAVVPPKRVGLVAVLIRSDARRAARFPFRWSFSYGDPNAVHDKAVTYRMPFGGPLPRLLTQGPNGRFSHRGRAAWSFDFGMPIGTPIRAAREGTVVERTDGYSRSGITEDFLDRANAVTVLHDDGTFGTYAHLDPGVGVREGMRVAAGDVLGFSGNTGFSTGPHLHFSVWKATWDGGVSLPIRFELEPGTGQRLVEGRRYPPACTGIARGCSDNAPPAAPAASGRAPAKPSNGRCRCRNGAIITTRLPCRAVCPERAR